MKNLLFSILILIISCTANQAQFRETTNMNYLEIGPYTLGIDKKFELMGTFERDLSKESFSEPRGSQIKSTEYLFADLTDGPDNISRGLIVYDNQLRDPQQYWSNEISYENTEVSGKVDSGVVDVGRIKMAYMILRAKPTIDKNIMKVIGAKGSPIGKNFQEQEQVSMIYFAKLIGRSRNLVMVYIDGKENAELAFNESLRYLTLDK